MSRTDFGADLQVVREESDVVVYRGWRGDDAARTAVLVVVPAQDPPTPGSLERLAHEYGLKDALDGGWAARPLELVREHGRTLLVLADPGGEPLDRLLGGPMEVGRFLRLAAAVAEALAKVHQRGLVHKDIKPAHILVDEAGRAARLTGFGIASRLPREHPAPEPPEVIAGTLAYMAPEQTGRMNRSVDSRSDLYALGVTFYQMLTGVLPFAAAEPMEWVHCHIARRPLPPAERLPGLPAVLSAIVMKCLAKTAEERYQTAAGVTADLRRCRAEWEATGTIGPFVPGMRDVPDVLRIPEKLYGREQEVSALLAAFERVVSSGRPELVLVSGYSGIGKSSVVNELHKAIVPPRGLFAAGKFDQYKRNIPYAPLAQVFQALVRHLLVKSEEDLAAWRQAILAALGPNGRLVIDLMPELEPLIGPQPPVPELAPREAENRFLAVLGGFLRVFARRQHPLVLFLDDLQWLDMATLKFLAHVVSHPDTRYLLAIGAYRDNEVGPAHPLTPTLQSLRETGTIIGEVVLAPLSHRDLCRLVGESVGSLPSRTEPLGWLIHQKTGGNPFFAIQFLTALWEGGLLAFDAAQGAWTWDIGEIRARGFTDNVVDLMVAKLKRLPAATQEALQRFSCLGGRADVATLALVQGKPAAVDADLWDAVREGLVFRSADAYTFLHDRVQEAAYALVPEASRKELHLKIGRLLLARYAREAQADGVFDVVNQLNHSVEIIADAEERATLRRLNAQAGRKARGAVAYASARRYLAQAAALLPPDRWEGLYSESLALLLDLAECEYLVGNFQRSDELLTEVLEKARSTLDRVRVYRLRQRLYQLSGRYREAMAVAFEALGLLGVKLPETEEDIRAATEAEIRQIPISLRDRRIADLVDEPMASAADVRATISLLAEAMPLVYTTRPIVWPLITAKGVNLCLQHGHAEEAPFVYSCYAMVAVSICGDIPAALQFSEMAIGLNERFERAAALRGKLLFHHAAVVTIWCRHFATSLPLLDQAFLACLDAGDIVCAGYLTYNAVWLRLELGDSLDDVTEVARRYAAFARQSRHDVVYNLLRIEEQFAASLKGTTRASTDFSDANFDEAGCVAAIERAGFGLGIAYYHIMKQIAAFLDERYDEALECAARAAPMLLQVAAMANEATHHFYHALTLAALHPRSSADQQQRFTQALREILPKLKFWADQCSENFANRHALVAAEIARIEGCDLEAMRLYEQAVRSAHDNGFAQNEALANELAGRFYLERSLETNGLAHLRKARACYARWGADGKVKQLDRRYPRLAVPEIALPMATIGAPLQQMDVAAVVKASQAVSGEIELPRLIETLMTIALQNAGADRGLLILPCGAAYRIEAEARASGDKVAVALRHAARSGTECPETVLRYVIRTRESVILDDASRPGLFGEDAYLRRRPPSSVFCLPLVRQAKLAGVLYLENTQATHAFTPGRIAVLELLAAQAAISLENTRLYGDLREREAKIRRLVDANIIGILIWDLKGGVSEANDAFLAMTGYSREDLVAGRLQWKDMTPAEWRAADQRALDQIKATGTCQPFEKEYVRKDGSRVPVLLGGALFEGSRHEGVAFVLDLSERKQAEERQRLLLDELNHRVKNTLATVMAISAQTFRTAQTPEAFRQAFEGRLLALSHTHNLLNRSRWTGVSLRDVLAQELAPYANGDSSRFLLSGDEVRLGPVAVVTLGMAFHELATNAAKYGALSVPTGQVRVAWQPDAKGRLHLDWQEAGGPPVQPPRRRGFGSRLIERSLAGELRGEVRLDFAPEGVHCVMDMALDRVCVH